MRPPPHIHCRAVVTATSLAPASWPDVMVVVAVVCDCACVRACMAATPKHRRTWTWMASTPPTSFRLCLLYPTVAWYMACASSSRLPVCRPRSQPCEKAAMSHECVLDAQPAFDAVYCEGIRAVDDFDVATADRLGFSIKLLGISSKVGDKVLQRVHPGAQRWVALRCAPICFLSCTRLIWPGWPWWHPPLCHERLRRKCLVVQR
eukprot:COSAG01_NODE_1496_length_10123_cov_3.358739_10_plen_205_part_00